MKKKALNIALKVLIACIVVGGLGYGGYWLYQSKKDATASADATEYVKVQVGTGNLEKTVIGTGTLSISQTQDVKVDYPVVVTNVRVSAGEKVAVGDPLMDVDTDSLQTAITSLESDLDTANSTLLQLAKGYSDDSTLTLATGGRVKAIYASIGDKVEDVMAAYGGLMLLSMDGKMKVSIEASDLDIGDTVQVLDGSSKYTGTVEDRDNGKVTVTFVDTYTLDGSEVKVVKNSIILGDGTARINMPYVYTSSEKGYISKIYQKLNGKPGSRASLFYVTQVPVSTEYTAQQKTRDTILQQIMAAKAILAAGTIASPIDGIVSSVVSASDVENAAGTALATLYVGNAKQMIISVDELDIINVSVGQEVTIEMDAITDKTYSATVSYISQIGTSSSGVTTYDVTLKVDGDDQLKIGMNGTATVHVGDAEGVLLVPITALNTSKDGQYVWLYSDTTTEDSDEPGIKTFVTTGLSSDSYAEVKSGLKSGDYVMVTRTASTTTNNSQMFGGMDVVTMTGGEGGQMPSGGGNFTPPSGGGTYNRQNNNSNNGGTRNFPSGGGQGN